MNCPDRKIVLVLALVLVLDAFSSLVAPPASLPLRGSDGTVFRRRRHWNRRPGQAELKPWAMSILTTIRTGLMQTATPLLAGVMALSGRVASSSSKPPLRTTPCSISSERNSETGHTASSAQRNQQVKNAKAHIFTEKLAAHRVKVWFGGTVVAPEPIGPVQSQTKFEWAHLRHRLNRR
jgi:hypothetical protein